jgi:SAM-dependent methyltransferase
MTRGITQRSDGITSAKSGAPSPERIMSVASGFMSAKHLFAASELGLFEALADAPATLDALAARTGLTRRAARISADAMVALGLLERHGDIYANSDVAATYLAGTTSADLRPLLRFWDRVSYPAWSGMADALGSGPAQEIVDLDGALQEISSAGIEAATAASAAALVEVVDWGARGRLLDIGGGTGYWSIAVVRAQPRLRATVFELPTVAAIARRRIAEAGLGSRIAVVAGDVSSDPLPTGYDVGLLANVAHHMSPEENRRLLSKVRDAVEPGAQLLIADFWTDSSHTAPLIAALMAGEFAVHIRDGDVYSVEEAQQWLEATSWTYLDHRPLAGPVSLIVAEAS